MKNDFREKLARYRHLILYQVVEFYSQTIFIFIVTLFFLESMLDYILWRCCLLEIPASLRGCLLGILLAGNLLLSWRVRQKYRHLPHSDWDTFYFLQWRHSQVCERATTLGLTPLSGNVESALDFLENMDKNAVKGNQSKNIENELQRAVIAQAECEMENFEPIAWMRLEKMWRVRWGLRAGAIVCVILWLVFSVINLNGSENFRVAQRRFFLPWEENTWQIDFRPQWKSFSDVVLTGGTFNAEIDPHANVPYVLVALWEAKHREKGDDKPMRILRVEPILGRYRVRVPDVRENFSVSVFLPGEEPGKYGWKSVCVRTFPSLRDAKILVQPPSMTQQPSTVSDWEIVGLTGSRIGVAIVADRALKAAKIRFDNATYVPGVAVNPYKDGSSRQYMFRFELLRECNYWLELTDAEGLTVQLERHLICPQEDIPPIVRCVQPDSGRKLLPGAKLGLIFEAQDDFGLRSLGFRWVAEMPLPENNGFSTPLDRSGNPKWSGMTVWEAPNWNEKPITGSNTEKQDALPLSHRYEYTWNLENISLTPGMRLRLEALVHDAGGLRGNTTPYYFYVATTEEMQLETFRQWVGITQEMRRIGKFFAQAREMFQHDLTLENAEKTADFLTQGIATITRLLNPESVDGIPWQITNLERDLTENPEFPFHENVSSKQQLITVRNLRELLATIQNGAFPALNQETVRLSKTLQLTKPSETGANSPSVPAGFPLENGRRIVTLLDSLLETLRPAMKIWGREEHLDTMRLEFRALAERQNALATLLLPTLDGARFATPAVTMLENEATFQAARSEMWAIRRDTEHFFLRYADLLESSKGTRLPDEGRELIRKQEQALSALLDGRFWDLQRQMNALPEAFLHVERSWLKSVPNNPVREKLLVFERMRNTQEKALHLLETCTETTRIQGDTTTEKVKFVPITRLERAELAEFATFQKEVCTYFTPDAPQKSEKTVPTLRYRETPFFGKNLSEILKSNEFKSRKTPENAELPRVLKPMWDALVENLEVSMVEFRTLARNECPSLEMLQDQYTLQLQIFDQFAELAQIADYIPEESATTERNSLYENRLKNSNKNQDDEGKNEVEIGTTDATQEVKPEDIQVLISMQMTVRDACQHLSQEVQMSDTEKASELEFLCDQERKIATGMETLGFNAQKNTTFSNVLSQVHQVVYLLENQDIGTLTLSIQEEIIYLLASTLRHEKAPSDTLSTAENVTQEETEDLSQNTDSQSRNNSKNAEMPEAPITEILPEEEGARELQRLQNTFWGELPKRQQERLELRPPEKPIPEYEKMLEIYYRNLNK